MASTFLNDLETHIAAEVAGAEQRIVALAEDIGPVVLKYTKEFLTSVAQIALGAVLDQVPLVLSGAEKFGAAVTHVIQQVEAKGQTIAVTDAQLAVQATYEKVAAAAQAAAP